MNKIKMMVGQQGPSICRLPGQVLVVGVEIGAEEAQRLVDGHIAAEVREIQLPDQSSTSTLAIAASTVAADALEPAPAEPAPAEPAPAEPAPAPAKRVRVKKSAAQG